MMNPQILVELQESMGNDLAIAKAAWTSSLSLDLQELKTDQDVERIVNMLADKKHSVPFESVVFRFWIRMPIQTDRQHMTHRIASHSGLSGRYRTMPNDWLHVPDDVIDILSKFNAEEVIGKACESMCSQANTAYQAMLSITKINRDNGTITPDEYKRVREYVRGILPLNNMTERVTIINLRSFANYYKLRSELDAQPEIQQVANSMFTEIVNKNICPIAIKALEVNNWII